MFEITTLLAIFYLSKCPYLQAYLPKRWPFVLLAGMKLLISIVLFVFLGIPSLWAVDLRSGDILLQPLDCWSCRLIQDQEDSHFAHMGMVLKFDNKIMVAEAYKSVRLVTLKEFLKKTAKGKKVLARRLDVYFYIFQEFEQRLKKEYFKYDGFPYDAQFLWSNEINGKEAIYCSELVYKVFQPLVKLWDIKPKPMLFDVNPDLWDRYFRGHTPRGEIGISPEDFAKGLDFYDIGEL